MASRKRKTIPSVSRGRAGIATTIATLACVALTACGSSSQIAKVATRTSPIRRVPVATQRRAHVVHVEHAKPVAAPQGIHMIAEFAACMRKNGVNVPPPTPARSDPQLDTRGIDTRSSIVRAASDKCDHYLRVSTSSG
jgi:hypothetical protein